MSLTVGVSACGDSNGPQRAEAGVGGEETGGGSPDATAAAANAVEWVRLTASYGECGGYCQQMLLVRPDSASLHFAANGTSDTPPIDKSLALDPTERAQILAAAAEALSSPWEARYGCPDCKDQETYHLEVSANGTVRETVLDPVQHPALFDPLLAAIAPVLREHPVPTSICAVAPGNCTEGQVSLVLTLDTDGALKPTWYNDLDHTVFLPGCTTVTFERVDNGVVTWSGPAAMCGWEGYARMLGPLGVLGDFALSTKGKPGTYRATGSFSEGCTAGVPLSQAACTAKTAITSNSITVAE
jgi:hypothetical protein